MAFDEVSKPRGAHRPQGQARKRQSPFWRGPWPIVGTLAGIVVLVVVFVLTVVHLLVVATFVLALLRVQRA